MRPDRRRRPAVEPCEPRRLCAMPPGQIVWPVPPYVPPPWPSPPPEPPAPPPVTIPGIDPPGGDPTDPILPPT